MSDTSTASDTKSTTAPNTDPVSEMDLSDEKVRAKLMEHYNIKCVPVDYFLVGGFRYSNLEDAIAQAKRETIADT